MKDKRMKYTCTGDVRSDCGIKHKTIAAAIRCIEKDSRGCGKFGGYSDRIVTHEDGGRLDDDESAEAMREYFSLKG